MMEPQTYFYNARAKDYTHQTDTSASPTWFHSQLPRFESTPLIRLSKEFFDHEHVYIKDESRRLGLPSFKILGASWGTFRSIAKSFGLPLNTDLVRLRAAAQGHNVHLVTATDGNHGRAIARMAHLLGVGSTIFVPNSVNEYTRSLIRNEGAEVVVESGDYDAAVMTAYRHARQFPTSLYIQDTSFEGYHEVPAWIVQGYSTMFQEAEDQLAAFGLKATHMVTPVGVGSLAHSVVVHCKSKGRNISVVAVESEMAACLQTSLRVGSSAPVATKTTIMDGINCGTVSDISWPVLRNGVDAAVTISDAESHEMVVKLATAGVEAGPCGASTSAALQKLLGFADIRKQLELDERSVVVLLNTEGPREYNVPGEGLMALGPT